MNGLIAYAPMQIQKDGMYLIEPEVLIPSADQLLEMTSCSKKHNTPQENCYCGIHLTLQPSFIKSYFNIINMVEVQSPMPILGEFFIFGSVIFESNLNIRAQKASLTGLFFPGNPKVAKLAYNSYLALKKVYLEQGSFHSFPQCYGSTDNLINCSNNIGKSYLSPDNISILKKFRKYVPETFINLLKESWSEFK